jgi:predicted transposase YdaD
MAQAKTTLEVISAEPDVQRLARERQLALDTYWFSMAAARTEGRKEGREEGEAIGRQQGEARGRGAMLKRLVATRFGSLPVHLEARIDAACAEQLDAWFDSALTAPSLSDLFGPKT